MSIQGGHLRPTAPAAGEHPRLDSLTTLRFFAALLIFVHHSTRLWTGPAKITALRNYLFEPMAFGVSFFFILSGFVLTWSARPGQRYSRFEWNRFSRIYPNYILGFVAAVFVYSTRTDWWVRVLDVTMLQSWVPEQRVYFSGNPVSWSLSDEAFFYAVFPLAIYLLARRSFRGQVVALGLVVAAIAAVQFTAHQISLGGAKEDIANGLYLANYFPPARLLEFLVGILLALIYPRLPRIPLLPALALVVLAIYGIAVLESPTKWVVVTLIPLSLLIVAAAQSDSAGRWSLLRNRWLVVLGTWSFALYIVHVLIMDTFVRATGFASTSTREAFEATVLLFVICLVAAAAMYYLWERPIEGALRRYQARRTSGADPPTPGGIGAVDPAPSRDPSDPSAAGVNAAT